MRKVKVYLLALSVLAATGSFAQTKKAASSGGTNFGIGVEAGLPVGDYLKQYWSFGIGASAKAGFNIFEGGDVTLSAGYISFLGKDIAGTTVKNKALGTIPIKAGLRFRISDGLYGEPQLGYTIAKQSGSSGNLNGFTYAANLGYMVNNSVDIAVRYEAWSKSANGVSVTPSFVGLRVGFALGGK